MHTRSSSRFGPSVTFPPNPRRFLPPRLPFPYEVYESPDTRISATTAVLREVTLPVLYACRDHAAADRRSGFIAKPKPRFSAGRGFPRSRQRGVRATHTFVEVLVWCWRHRN